MKRRMVSAIGFLFLAAGSAWGFPAAEANPFSPAPAVKKLYCGEKLTYEIRYLGMPVGRAVSEILGIEEVRGRKAYHVRVQVRSYPVIDLIYKVRDEHYSKIDAVTFASLGYEKKIREGRRRVYERSEFDQERHRARYFDEKGNFTEELEILPSAQDALSCGYFSRTLELKEKSSVFIPVHADKKNWNLEVRSQETGVVEIKSVGKFKALRAEPLMEFQGIFIRKGKVDGWISLDARRIPLTMKVKIPVLGNISARLIEYEAGKEST